MKIDLDFKSLESFCEDFTLNGVTYRIKEASGAAAVKFRNAVMKATIVSNGQVVGFDKLASTETLLVSLCVTQVKSDGKEAPLTVEQVGEFPYKVQRRLYDTIKKVSDLEEGEPVVNGQVRLAFSRTDSPMSLSQLRSWVSTLPSEQFAALQELVKETPEELAKNVQSGTTDGSE